MRKPAFCICKNKATDQLRSKSASATYATYIFYTTIPLLPKSLAIFCDYTAWFMSDWVGNTENSFSRMVAQMVLSSVA